MLLAESFATYFLVQIAHTQAQRDSVYAIRYNVYCKEFGYESPAAFPDGRERDEYDDQAIHALIIHRATGRPAACVRLVPARSEDENIPLPFEKYCAESIDTAFVRGLGLDRSTLCEISRLAVDGRFRRRACDEGNSYGVIGPSFSKEELRTFPLIAVAAFLAATALTEVSGRGNVFAMMEPFLPRLLRRSGIAFKRAGRDADYHGMRAPYFITSRSAIDNMKPELLSLYLHIRQCIGESCAMPDYRLFSVDSS